jgi:hypothetical protein
MDTRLELLWSDAMDEQEYERRHIARYAKEAPQQQAARNFLLQVFWQMTLNPTISVGLSFAHDVIEVYESVIRESQTPGVFSNYWLGQEWLRENREQLSDAAHSLFQLIDKYHLEDWMVERLLATFEVWGLPKKSMRLTEVGPVLVPPERWRGQLLSWEFKVFGSTKPFVDENTLSNGLAHYSSPPLLAFNYRPRGNEKFSDYKQEMVEHFAKHLKSESLLMSEFNETHFKWLVLRQFFGVSAERIAKAIDDTPVPQEKKGISEKSVQEGVNRASELAGLKLHPFKKGRLSKSEIHRRRKFDRHLRRLLAI